jgi:hypothetical protein
MPTTKKGKKIESAMVKEYGKEKGKAIFYASINKGKIKGTGTKTEARKRKKRMPKK